MEQFLPLIINIAFFIKANGVALTINEFKITGEDLGCWITKSRRRSCLQPENRSSISNSNMDNHGRFMRGLFSAECCASILNTLSSFFRNLIAPELGLLNLLTQV